MLTFGALTLMLGFLSVTSLMGLFVIVLLSPGWRAYIPRSLLLLTPGNVFETICLMFHSEEKLQKSTASSGASGPSVTHRHSLRNPGAATRARRLTRMQGCLGIANRAPPASELASVQLPRTLGSVEVPLYRAGPRWAGGEGTGG